MMKCKTLMIASCCCTRDSRCSNGKSINGLIERFKNEPIIDNNDAIEIIKDYFADKGEEE